MSRHAEIHFYSEGEVASIKERSSHRIWVIAKKDRFLQQEDSIALPTVSESSFETDNGTVHQKDALTNAIPAYWLKLNSNRVTSPDVRRGDNVLIWRLGNSDKYFWTDYNSANVKRLETAVYAFSADPNNPVKDDLSNAYVFAISAHDKHITLQTSTANGEPYAYTVQIDTEVGKLVLEDDRENNIYIDSPETTIGLHNANGTHFKLNKKKIDGYAPDSIKLEAVNSINLKCKDFILDATNTTTINTKTFTTNGETITLNASTVTSNAPLTQCTGLLKAPVIAIGGGARNANSGAAASIIGDIMVTGNMNVTGIIQCGSLITADLTAAKGTIAEFSHGGKPCC